MTAPIGRICLLLASADLSLSEVRSFARWVEKNGAQRVVATIERLRHVADEDDTPVRSYFSSIRANQEANAGRHSELSTKVERLLIEEAGLTRWEAAKLLRSELESEPNVEERIPDPGRTAFKSWIDRVAEAVSESVLLHVVTRLRNRLVHTNRPDWPLKREGE